MKSRNQINFQVNARIELSNLASEMTRQGDTAVAAILHAAVRAIDRRIAHADRELSASPSKRRQSSLINRNIRLHGRRTCIRLETEFWQALESLARARGGSINQVCETAVDQAEIGSATSAIRAFVLREVSAVADPLERPPESAVA